jgi:uroporphyrinogen-III synthase
VVVFTGAAAVTATIGALRHAGKDARSLAGLTLAGIGRETVTALRRAGLRADLRLRSYLPIRVTAALARRLGALDGVPVLLVRDGQEGSALAAGLASAGARVTSLQLATRAVDGRGRQLLDRSMASGRLDAVVLPSSSAAEALVAAGLSVPERVLVIAIGPTTAATAVRLGLPQARTAAGGEQGLVEELLSRFGAGDRSAQPSRSAAADS